MFYCYTLYLSLSKYVCRKILEFEMRHIPKSDSHACFTTCEYNALVGKDNIYNTYIL